MDKVQAMRTLLGFPMPVSSAYRCENHPDEVKKDSPGWHNRAAIDIAVSHERAYKLVQLAMSVGIKGIGINQKGTGRFIHLDMRDEFAIWTY